MNKYKDWPLLEVMPDGWKIDKTVGSPLYGYEFVTNCKSVLNGQKRALLLVIHKDKKQQTIIDEPKSNPADEIKTDMKGKNWDLFDASTARTVNDLARQKFKRKILLDILVDLTICEIEGWCKLEYIKELKSMISNIGQKPCLSL